MDYLKIMEESKSISDWIIKIRRELHEHPELMYEEFRTSEVIRRELDKLDIDPTGLGGEGTTADRVEKLLQKQKDFERKNRRRDTIESSIGQMVQVPIYTRLLEDAAKRRLELDKAMLGAREMMPSNIQNIMLSKQSQRSLASSAFAEEAKAIAAQQEAATGFGGLGMQRSFGQPNVGNFKLG